MLTIVLIFFFFLIIHLSGTTYSRYGTLFFKFPLLVQKHVTYVPKCCSSLMVQYDALQFVLTINTHCLNRANQNLFTHEQ